MTDSPKVIYDSFEEYANLSKEFKDTLSEFIRNHKIDDWTFSNFISNTNTNAGIQFSNRFEQQLLQPLSKLTKHQIPEWTNEVSEILSDALRGMAKSVAEMNHTHHYISNCSECENEDRIEMLQLFQNPAICNVMCMGIINNVLFDTEGEECGREQGGMLRKVRQFRCHACSKPVDEMWFDADNICTNCRPH
jgi:hypothetical protein